MTNEQEAIALENNRTLLLRRLKEAKAVLVGRMKSGVWPCQI